MRVENAAIAPGSDIVQDHLLQEGRLPGAGEPGDERGEMSIGRQLTHKVTTLAILRKGERVEPTLVCVASGFGWQKPKSGEPIIRSLQTRHRGSRLRSQIPRLVNHRAYTRLGLPPQGRLR